ncbi:zmp-1 [Pristionchus pacificus]|uniref:Zmp-1 n=1 Tax=Pristionchus pacificus TaxID=54126 RepID=A0A2A6CV66_PRIPA|nr:zmp-1 [Pristionchus pacificus]|eukprot:PDM81976.1 zmp-1 [Pristionchus pacificus]
MIVLFLLLLFEAVAGAEHQGAEVEIPWNDYLRRYGYLTPEKNTGGAARMIDATEAISKFQNSRYEDYGPLNGRRRAKRSVFSKWKKTNLTYFILDRPSYMDARLVDGTIWQAFQQWMNISTLQFRPARGEKDADIVISFPHPQTHANCSSRFAQADLAHAFFPETGRVHFNMDWRWDTPNRLASVTVHELGHAIGLVHSPDAKSVMYALNTPDTKHITTVEINELRESYGVKPGIGWVEEDFIRRESPVEVNTPPNPCKSTVDAAFRRRGQYIFFKAGVSKIRQIRTPQGGWMWRFSSDTRTMVGVNRIEQFYRGVGSVDAAVEVDDQVYLFSGTDVYIEMQGRMSGAMSLRQLSIRDSDKIDSAFVWHATNFEGHPGVYLMDESNGLYYRFDTRQRRIVPHYPKQRNLQWSAIPKVDAALSFGPKNDLLFIRGNEALMLNQTESGGVRVADGYPRELWSMFEYCRWKEGIVDIPSKREAPHHYHDHNHRALRHSSSSLSYLSNCVVIALLAKMLL